MSVSNYLGVPFSQHDSLYARAHTSKFNELIAAGCHPDDADSMAREHARSMQISQAEAIRSRQVVEALGITYGAAPAPTTPIPQPTDTPAEADALDSDSIITDLNSNRK